MLGETMTAFELPAISAILDLQVDIYLTEGEASLPEYPPPQPRAYLRFDAVPSTSQYDAEGRLEDLQWHWEQHRPKKAQRMYVGINGGREVHIMERSIQLIFENKYKEHQS